MRLLYAPHWRRLGYEYRLSILGFIFGEADLRGVPKEVGYKRERFGEQLLNIGRPLL